MAIHNPVTAFGVNSSGNSEAQTVSNGAAHIRQAASDVQDPATWHLSFADEAADVNDNTIVYESPDVSMYNHHEFTIYTAPGAGAVEVFISFDGSNYEATPVQVISDALVEGAVIQSVNEMTAVGNYHFTRKVKQWKLQNKGATTGQVTEIRGSHSVI